MFAFSHAAQHGAVPSGTVLPPEKPVVLRLRPGEIDEPGKIVRLDGDHPEIAVEAPHLWDPLFLEGEVVWLQPLDGAARVGVRFYHRSGRTLRTLTELLEAEAYH